MTYCYRMFDCRVVSEFPVPELPSLDPGAKGRKEICVYLARNISRPREWLVGWPGSEGRTALRIGRTSLGYVLEFNHSVAYLVAPGRASVYCEGREPVNMPELRRFLIDQVIPRMRAQQGELVLHAAGVCLDVHAIALMGPSGFGKSTLTAAFARKGASILGDDALMLSCSGRLVHSVGAYPGLRLWPDSAAASGLEGYRRSAVSASTRKLRYLPEGETDDAGQPCLRAIVALDRRDSATRTDVEIVEVGAVEAIAYLDLQAFKMDSYDRERSARLLAKLACVVKAVPIVRATYPRTFAGLDVVAERILRELTNGPATRTSGDVLA